MDGSPDDEFAEYEADVPGKRLSDTEAYGLELDLAGPGHGTGPTLVFARLEPCLDRSRTVPAYLVGRQRIELTVWSTGTCPRTWS